MAFRFEPKELVARLAALAKRPAETWAQLAKEPVDDLWDLFPVAALLAAVRPLAGALGALFFSGFKAFALSLLLAPLAWGISVISAGVVAYGVFVFAPYLNSRPDFLAAIKLVCWGLSAYWLSLAGYLIPVGYLLVLFRLAGVLGTAYLWFYGFPALLDTPKAPPTSLVLFVAAAGCAYSLLVYLLDEIFLYTFGPWLSQLLF